MISKNLLGRYAVAYRGDDGIERMVGYYTTLKAAHKVRKSINPDVKPYVKRIG